MERKAHLLTEKYADLPGSKPVERAVQKSLKEGKPGPKNKEDRVGVYLDRLESITDDERGLELLENKLLRQYTIDTSDEELVVKLAKGLYESEKRIAIERGQGAMIEQINSTDAMVEKYRPLVEEKAKIQRQTLSAWFSGLQEHKNENPMWFRYFAIRSLYKMGTLDKEKVEYTKRTPLTVAPFPEFNFEAIGKVRGWLAEGATETGVSEERQAVFAKALKTKDFATLYAVAQLESAGRLNRESLEGAWRKYDQGSDPTILEQDLKDKGTGWCTATGSAAEHLQGGDFYVYYTKGTAGAATEPRVAIRMENDQVVEVRGVNQGQELEPELIDIAQKQYCQLPGGEKYDKKARDMKLITGLAKKQEQGKPFTKDDLVFLYEIDGPIEGFGYNHEKDPRIAKLRNQRDLKTDASIVFDCMSNEIAWNQLEISEKTKAYIGPLFKDIFKKLSHLEHLYTTFPEGKIRRTSLELTYKSAEQYRAELEKAGFRMSDFAQHMLKCAPELERASEQSGLLAKIKKALSKKEVIQSDHVDLVRLTVKDIGFPRGATMDRLYEKVLELGLELCPAQVAPELRLQYIDQPFGEYVEIGTKRIVVPGDVVSGRPRFFWLYHGDGGRWLSDIWIEPSDECPPENLFVFRLRK